MKKVLLFIIVCVIMGAFASCASTRDCPSHDKNFFTRGGGGSKWR